MDGCAIYIVALVGGKIAFARDPVTREDDVPILDWGDPEAEGPVVLFEAPADVDEEGDVEIFTLLSAN